MRKPGIFAALSVPLLAAILAGGAAAQAPSSAPAGSPLYLTISKDSARSRVGLDYAVRWDFSDLASLRPGLGLLYSGVKAISAWDITENTRLDYYGFRTNPWRLVIAKEKKKRAGAAATPPAGGGSGVVSGATPEYRKRLRLSVSPLVDDLKRNFDDGLRDFLLRSSLKGLSPEWEKMGAANRRAFVKDVLAIGIWDSGLPVAEQTGEGLRYLDSGKEKPPPPAPKPFVLPK